jgi:hypothetical protein
MSDLHELQLALDLPESLSDSELALLRRHLGQEGEGAAWAYEGPLFAQRGAAYRIGGALVGELCAGSRGWALTVRQEVHPEQFDALRRLMEWIGARTTSVGVVGHLRFLEDDVPELLLAQGGTVRRMTLRAQGPADSEAIPDPWA